jgi:glycosyltransferase involved in cell wall biosynthesis
MAIGKAHMAFDLEETRFCADGAALYAQPNDAEDFARKVLELLSSPEQRAAMGRIGLHRIESEFSAVHAEKHLLNAYRRLLGQ